VGFLKAEAVGPVVSALELHASYVSEDDLFTADRKDFTPSPFGLNIDWALLLDFDANGYLSAAEVFGRRASFVTKNIPLPSSTPPAAVRLARVPETSATEEFDCPVTVYASPNGFVAQAIVPDLMPGAVWFSLGKTFLVALNEGRIASVLFADTRGVESLQN